MCEFYDIYSTMKFTRLALALALALPAVVSAQTQSLNDYVRLALKQNPGFKQHALLVAERDAAVGAARGLYLPNATLNARYSRTNGNVLNLGDLVNPAFAALNQVVGRSRFPTNVDFSLPLRQETTVRLTQPIFQPEIVHVVRIATSLADAQQAQRDAAARQLVADVRAAYLQLLKARRAAEIYEATESLLQENLRVSERLVANGSATPNVVLRARAELSDIQQQRAEALRLVAAAGEAFNFRIGRSLTESVEVLPDSALDIDSLPALDEVLRVAALGRAELRQLEHARAAAAAERRLAQARFLPSLAVALDYGVQGRDYRFGSRDDFALVSLVASWNLFNGGQDAARVQVASLAMARYETQRADVAQAVLLEARTAWHATRVARSAIQTARERLTSARRTFELVRRRRDEGLASQLEFLDARSALTSAELNLVITTYDYYLRRVELDRAAALDRITP